MVVGTASSWTTFPPTMVISTSRSLISDGSTANVDDRVLWVISDPAIVSVDATGEVTTLAEGLVDISAELNGITSNTFSLEVLPADLTEITITAPAASVELGSTLAFSASGLYTAGTVEDLTSQVSWVSSDEAIATLAADGLLSPLAEGNVDVHAALAGVMSNVLNIDVLPAPVTAITIASEKYFRPSVFKTSKKRGPAWYPTEKINSAKPTACAPGLIRKS